MIEFTILELTLLVLCVGLFIYGFQQNKRMNHFGALIGAMCRDRRLYDELCKEIHERDRGVA